MILSTFKIEGYAILAGYAITHPRLNARAINCNVYRVRTRGIKFSRNYEISRNFYHENFVLRKMYNNHENLRPQKFTTIRYSI